MGRAAEKVTTKPKAMAEEPEGTEQLPRALQHFFLLEKQEMPPLLQRDWVPWSVSSPVPSLVPLSRPMLFLPDLPLLPSTGPGCCAGPAPPPPREGVAEPGPGGRARNREGGM